MARLSAIGNDKHNPGQPLHWSRDKSADHADCLARHLLTHGRHDPDTGLSHTVAVAWRALALLQTEIEARRAENEAYRRATDPPRRLRVYIAGPITKGDLVHNIRQGTEAFISLALAGFAPHCPQWSAFSGEVRTALLWGEKTGPVRHVIGVAGAAPNQLTHGDWLAVDMAWLAKADAVLRLPGESVGADRETAEAARLGIPVFYSIPDLIAWAADARHS